MEERSIKLTCAEPGCGRDWILTGGEQRFYREKFGPGAQPRRCPDCRRARRLMQFTPQRRGANREVR
jgi:hypothetical protein